MKTRLLFAASCLLIFSSWIMHPKNELRMAEWLIGTWENKTSRGSVFETWNKVSEHEFAGKSYVVNQKDTVIFETIRLVQEKDGLYYAPAVREQNKGLPVRFALKTISDTQLIFENLKHDFPQVISYTKITKDSLLAEISGIKDGKNSKIQFPMKRVK